MFCKIICSAIQLPNKSVRWLSKQKWTVNWIILVRPAEQLFYRPKFWKQFLEQLLVVLRTGIIIVGKKNVLCTLYIYIYDKKQLWNLKDNKAIGGSKIPCMKKLYLIATSRLICNINVLACVYLIHLLCKGFQSRLYIFSGIIELLWTSSRNNENEPIVCS